MKATDTAAFPPGVARRRATVRLEFGYGFAFEFAKDFEVAAMASARGAVRAVAVAAVVGEEDFEVVGIACAFAAFAVVVVVVATQQDGEVGAIDAAFAVVVVASEKDFA